MKKEQYKKPILVTNVNIEGVVPAAAVLAVVSALSAGVASGTALRKMLGDNIDLRQSEKLVDVGAIA